MFPHPLRGQADAPAAGIWFQGMPREDLRRARSFGLSFCSKKRRRKGLVRAQVLRLGGPGPLAARLANRVRALPTGINDAGESVRVPADRRRMSRPGLPNSVERADIQVERTGSGRTGSGRTANRFAVRTWVRFARPAGIPASLAHIERGRTSVAVR